MRKKSSSLLKKQVTKMTDTQKAIRRPMDHELKCWPVYFQAVKDGRKAFEIRKFDRPYAVSDMLILREFDPQKGCYTGDSIVRAITYLLDMTYLPGDEIPRYTNYVALGIMNPTAAEALREKEARGCRCPCGEHDPNFCETCNRIRVEAIKEKLKRDKGCTYCMSPEIFARSSQIYCDMCGRRLEPKEAE